MGKLKSVGFGCYLFLSVFVIACFCVAALSPPLQSPDEFDHLKRAYWLTKGKFLLDTPEGRSSGGMIDSAMASYIEVNGLLTADPTRRVTAASEDEAGRLRWTGEMVFSSAPGTGYYFPVIYLPQAIGLKIGEVLSLSIDTSYRMARLFSLCLAALILLCAFMLAAPNPLVLGLLLLPMSIFQFGAASLDGMATALAIFSVSAYIYLCQKRREAELGGVFFALIISVALLVSSRVHLIPLLGLIFLLCIGRRRPGYYVLFAGLAIFVAIWTATAVGATSDRRVSLGAPLSIIVGYYLNSPVELVSVILKTIATDGIVASLIMTFIGVLGALDTFLGPRYYYYVFFGTIAVWLTSLQAAPTDGALRFSRWALTACALLSIGIVFFALLVSWTPHPATVVWGLQGRYFLIPIILLAYASTAQQTLASSLGRKCSLVLIGVIFFFSMAQMSSALVARYYMAPVN